MITIYKSDDLVVSFDEQHQVVISRFINEITLEIIGESFAQIRDVLDSGDYKPEAPLNLLVDVSIASQKTMFKIGDLGESIKFLRDDRIFYVMIVAPSGIAGKMTEFVGTLVAKLSNTRFRVFKSIEEAIVFLESPSNPFYQSV